MAITPDTEARYSEQDPEVVVMELEAAAGSLADRFDGLEGAQSGPDQRFRAPVHPLEGARGLCPGAALWVSLSYIRNGR